MLLTQSKSCRFVVYHCKLMLLSLFFHNIASAVFRMMARKVLKVDSGPKKSLLSRLRKATKVCGKAKKKKLVRRSRYWSARVVEARALDIEEIRSVTSRSVLVSIKSRNSSWENELTKQSIFLSQFMFEIWWFMYEIWQFMADIWLFLIENYLF